MPKIGNPDTHKLKGNFGYSAVGLKDLGATEYTLVTLVIDRSSSVQSFQNELTSAVKEVVNSCRSSKRADNLLIRIIQFGDDMEEIHGFKLLSQINADDYDNAIKIGGMTALYDASTNGIAAAVDFAEKLTAQDFNVNAIVVVLTDGDDNRSVMGAGAVKSALKDAMAKEKLESLISILIGVNMQDPGLAQRLDQFHKDAEFSQFIELKDASAKTLAKLAKFVSQSISSQSQALGTGGPSQLLTI